MIAPSILNANNMNLGHDIKAAVQSGISRFHIDIMDGHFVPNLSYGPELVKDFNREFPLTEAEVHLMSNNLEVTLPLFVEAGCDLLEFHIEATENPAKWLNYLHKNNVKAGLAISPDTPIERIKPFLNDIDQLLVMTVRPGFGGQSYIKESAQRIEEVRKLMEQANKKIPIEVDGGIDNVTIKDASEAGANIFVAGSYIFKKGPIDQQIHNLNKVIK